MNVKTIAIATASALIVLSGFSNPPPKHSPQPPNRHSAHPKHAPNKKHHSWGHGGENFWPGFIGGAVSSVISRPPIIPPPPPPQLTAPVVVPVVVAEPKVWVEGHYELQMVNGIMTQVWIPGQFVIIKK